MTSKTSGLITTKSKKIQEIEQKLPELSEKDLEDVKQYVDKKIQAKQTQLQYIPMLNNNIDEWIHLCTV